MVWRLGTEMILGISSVNVHTLTHKGTISYAYPIGGSRFVGPVIGVSLLS